MYRACQHTHRKRSRELCPKQKELEKETLGWDSNLQPPDFYVLYQLNYKEVQQAPTCTCVQQATTCASYSLHCMYIHVQQATTCTHVTHSTGCKSFCDGRPLELRHHDFSHLFNGRVWRNVLVERRAILLHGR